MSSRLDPDPLIRIIRSGKFLNKTLIAICASEGLSKAGVKAEYQQRIIESMLRLPSFHDLDSSSLLLPSDPLYTPRSNQVTSLLHVDLSPALAMCANPAPGVQYYSARNEVANFERLKRSIEDPTSLSNNSVPANQTSAVNAHLNATFNTHVGANMAGGVNGYRGFGGGIRE